MYDMKIYRCKNGVQITEEEFEKNKIILDTEDHAIEDGLNECTYSLTIPRCKYRFSNVTYICQNIFLHYVDIVSL